MVTAGLSAVDESLCRFALTFPPATVFAVNLNTKFGANCAM